MGVATGVLGAASGLFGLSKLWFIPTFLAALTYYNYDLYDPENQPIDAKNINDEYDFIVIGGGSAGSVVSSRLSQNKEWNVLLLEAGGQESILTDVPILSLYLHGSRYDWKYKTEPSDSACQAMVNKRCCWTREKFRETFGNKDFSVKGLWFGSRGVIPEKNKELFGGPWRGGKVIGGSSVLNTMLYIRGNRRDYDNWERMGNPGWGYEDVLPYFKKSQDQRNPYLAKNTRYHATGGLLTTQDSPWNTPLGLAFLQAGEEMGYDIVDVNGEQQTGFSLFQYTMRRGMRNSAAKAFLNPFRLRSNLHTALNAFATKIIMDPQTNRAVAVEFVKDGHRRVVRARKEIILSGGTINSAQLLMLSGIGPAQHLMEHGITPLVDLPGVGGNVMDHIAIGGIVFLIDYPISLVMNRMVNLNTALRYAISGDGPLTSSVGIETVGFITTKYGNQSDDWPDIEFMLTSASTPSDGGSNVRRAHCLTDSFYDEVFKQINNHDLFGVFPMMLRPKSRGQIRLRSKNPYHYPVIYHNYLTHPDDVRVLREGVKASIAFGETQAMKRFGARFYNKPLPNCKQYPLYTDEYWDCYVRQYTMTIYHMSGSCKMGPVTDPYAVVDPTLRVYGTQGLRVIDASIMPLITSGNINAPVIMIGEKGADMIVKYWKGYGKRRKREANTTDV